MRAGHVRKGLTRRLLLLILAATLTIPGAVAFEDGGFNGTRPTQWRVVWTDDPATTATVAWTTSAPGEVHQVVYRAVGEERWETARCQRNGRYSGDELDLYYHHATLRNLQPETIYELRLQSDNQQSPTLQFCTAPTRDRPLSLMFGGDSRSDAEMRRQVNRMMSQMFEESLTSEQDQEQIFALVHGGDYIVSGRDLAQWSEWMTDHMLTSTSENRLLPIIPARGNHDRGPLFNEVFGFPEGDDNYYAVDLSPEIRLVTLNTEISAAGLQEAWLERQLASSRPRVRWLVAQYHRPAYPAVKSPGDALRHWVPLFERYHVDLVAESDGHVIKRTMPIRDGQPDEDGVVYIGEGGLGVKQRTPKADRWFLQPPGMSASGHHVQLLTFTEDQLQYQCVLLGGEVLDRYSRVPRTR